MSTLVDPYRRTAEIVDTTSTNVTVVSTDDGTLGSRKVQRVGASRLVAFGRAAAVYLEKLDDAWQAARFAYRKARRGSLPYSAAIGPADPMANRIQDDSVLALTDDAPEIELYKDEDGRYFTVTMMNNGFVPHGRIVLAVEISEFQASRLIQQLEVLSLDADLTENEKVLLGVLKKRVRNAFADEIQGEQEV